MKLINIKESGTNNILLWAINNGGSIKEDRALISIINDELSYVITISDINFFELFRLTQMYRNEIHIIEEKEACVPDKEELGKFFNGIYKSNSNSIEDVKLSEIVEHCVNMFMNLSMQMMNDNHIIHPDVVKMFLPMISRKFTIQIPVTFKDFIDSMSLDEANEIYNKHYPNTLDDIINNESHGVSTTLQLGLVRSTSIIKYDQKYEKYIKIFKYSPLKSYNENTLYKFALLSFSKYDKITNTEIRVDLFNSNKETIVSKMKQIGNIDSPLEAEFIIQLPIQYMQILEKSFSQELVQIAYESSMSNIIDNGLIKDNFVTIDHNEDEYNDNEKYLNRVETYAIRINETNQITLNSIPILLNSDGDVDINSVFAMLPSIYKTNAVIRINIDDFEKIKSSSNDIIISEMFKEIYQIVLDINEDMKSYK